MARREFDALRRHQIDIRIVILARGRSGMHGAHYLFVLLWAGHGQHAWMHVADDRFFHAHAAGDDDFAVLGQGLSDRVQRLGLGAIDETTGIDDHHVGIVVFGRDLIALGAQLREGALGIRERFRTAQADKAYARCAPVGPARRRGCGQRRVGISRLACGAVGAFSGPGCFQDFQSRSP